MKEDIKTLLHIVGWVGWGGKGVRGGAILADSTPSGRRPGHNRHQRGGCCCCLHWLDIVEQGEQAQDKEEAQEEEYAHEEEEKGSPEEGEDSQGDFDNEETESKSFQVCQHSSYKSTQTKWGPNSIPRCITF